jgi:hypothetical protein
MPFIFTLLKDLPNNGSWHLGQLELNWQTYHVPFGLRRHAKVLPL